MIEFFSTHVSFSEFFAVTDPSGSSAKPAVIPLLTGTLVTTVIALLVAVPIYLSEYASKRARKWLKPTVELLAGVPSIVYGFFAVTFVTPVVLKGWLNLPVGFFNMLSAGLVLGVMIIPTVASLSEDAMSAVPLALRQGSLAMGANRMQTTLRVVFPAALGISRAVGETMIVATAAGNGKNFSLNPFDAAQTLTGFIATTARGENPVGSAEYDMLFAVGLLLFLITLVINAISIVIVRRFRQEY